MSESLNRNTQIDRARLREWAEARKRIAQVAQDVTLAKARAAGRLRLVRFDVDRAAELERYMTEQRRMRRCRELHGRAQLAAKHAIELELARQGVR